MPRPRHGPAQVGPRTGPIEFSHARSRDGIQVPSEGPTLDGRPRQAVRLRSAPGLITLVLYAAALVALALWGEDFVAWATPFADDWSSPWLGLFRGLLTGVLFALGLLLSVVTFTAVTLLVGQPFYENLSEKVDRDVSRTAPHPSLGLPLWRELWISARDSLRIVLRAAVWASSSSRAASCRSSARRSSR
ncbi:hypothetical protein SALBM311S_02726 [Streptomyces alboniger]